MIMNSIRDLLKEKNIIRGTWKKVCSLISFMRIRENVEGAISNAPSTFCSINPAAFTLLFQTFYFQFRLLVSKYFIISSLPSSVVKVTARCEVALETPT